MASSSTTLGGLYALGRSKELRKINFPREWRLWTRVGGPTGMVLAVVAGTVSYLSSTVHSADASISSFVAIHPELLVAIIFGIVSTWWLLATRGQEPARPS